ncbi:MAG: hypothetical protein D3910_28750 [Candidatus Electrothrix sp. ATG2]|nr:hypothetical protein [Candidatus Electrothrix sp. ATG2]
MNKRGQSQIKSVDHSSTPSFSTAFLNGSASAFRRRPLLPAPYNTAHHLIIFQFNIIQPVLQLCYDLSVQRMISNDQKIPVSPCRVALADRGTIPLRNAPQLLAIINQLPLI